MVGQDAGAAGLSLLVLRGHQSVYLLSACLFCFLMLFSDVLFEHERFTVQISNFNGKRTDRARLLNSRFHETRTRWAWPP